MSMSKHLVCLAPGSTMFRVAGYAGIILACCIVATPGYAELVVNGGFETGDFTGWTAYYTPSGSDMYVGSNYPHSGLHQALFAASGQYDDSIMQSLTTVPGQSYKIDFWLAHPFTDSSNEFVAIWNAFPLLSLTPASYFGYTEYTFTKVATDTTTILQFAGRDAPAYFYLDDVSVQPVPEPSTLVLLSAGVFSFLAYVCRKRKQAA
jgi:hypothetical protein